MTLNTQLVASLIRDRAGLPDDSSAARIISLIPQALKQTGRLLAADPFTRPLVTTDRETTIIALGAQGKLNLTTGYDSYQFLQEYFDQGQCYFLPSSEIAGTAATGTLTIQPATGTAAVGYLTVTTPAGFSTGTLTVTQGARAVGTYTVATLPNVSDTIIVNGTVFTFTTFPTANRNIQIQTTTSKQATEIVNCINSYVTSNPTSNPSKATYTVLGNVVNIQSIYYATTPVFTTVGNVRVTAQQAQLTGGIDGVQSGEIVNVNGIACVWSATPPPAEGDTNIYLGVPDTNASVNASTLASALSSSANIQLTGAAYTVNRNVVTITYLTAGAIGNQFYLYTSDLGHITRNAATLTGGTGGIVQGDQMTIGNSGGVTFTFSNYNASTAANTYLPFSSNGDPAESADLIAEALATKSSGLINVATYTSVAPPSPADDSPARIVKITYGVTGTTGNSYGLTTIPASIRRSGATLVGGVAGTVQNNETLVINGFTVTFKTSAGAFPDVQIGGTPTITATNLVTGLNASVSGLLNKATYSNNSTPVVTITYDSYGTAGNAFTLNYSSLYGVLPSGDTLTGGIGGVNITADTFTVENYVAEWADLDRVRFTTTDQFPTPLLGDTDYYLINYAVATDGLSATFQVAANSNGTGVINMTDTGSGILSVTQFSTTQLPIQLLANPQQINLPQYLSSEFVFACVDDGWLRLLPLADGTYRVGQVAFAQPFFPTNLAALPDSTEAERVFLDTLMEIVSIPVIPNA